MYLGNEGTGAGLGIGEGEVNRGIDGGMLGVTGGGVKRGIEGAVYVGIVGGGLGITGGGVYLGIDGMPKPCPLATPDVAAKTTAIAKIAAMVNLYPVFRVHDGGYEYMADPPSDIRWPLTVTLTYTDGDPAEMCRSVLDGHELKLEYLCGGMTRGAPALPVALVAA